MMKMSKKLLAFGLSAAMLLSLAACGSTTNTPATQTPAPSASTPTASTGNDLPEITLTLGSSAASSNDAYQFMVEAADAVFEKSGGKLKIDLVWDGTLGNDGELIESCMSGSVDMVSLSSSPLLSYIPEIAVFDMPMVFESTEQAITGLSSFTESFQPIMNAKNLHVMNVGFQQWRSLSTNVNITSPADFQNMSIRIMENKYHQMFWENLGAKPTPLAFSELYLSLQQGLVQAQDNPVQGIYASKFYEVQDYLMRITAFPFVSFVIMNENTYNSLPAEYQDLLREFADYYNTQSGLACEELDESNLAAMEGEITVLPYTDEIIQALRTAAEPVWAQIKNDIGDELPNALLAAAEAAK